MSLRFPSFYQEVLPSADQTLLSIMSGHFRSLPPQGAQSFGNFPQFSGFMKPCRFEGEVQNLEVQGTIPPEIDGTFYRVMPDPQFVPFIENDPASGPQFAILFNS